MPNRSKSRRGSLPISVLPLPQNADPHERACRKSHEKETGVFDWTPGIALALVGAMTILNVEKSLDKRKKREEREQRQKEKEKEYDDEEEEDRQRRYREREMMRRDQDYYHQEPPRRRRREYDSSSGSFRSRGSGDYYDRVPLSRSSRDSRSSAAGWSASSSGGSGDGGPRPSRTWAPDERWDEDPYYERDRRRDSW